MSNQKKKKKKKSFPGNSTNKFVLVFNRTLRHLNKTPNVFGGHLISMKIPSRERKGSYTYS
jgi:hypothetical protein